MNRAIFNLRRLLAGLLVLALSVSMAVAAPEPAYGDPENPLIISFERLNPVYSGTVEIGTTKENLGLPAYLRAVCEVEPGGTFVQTAPVSDQDGNFDYYWYGYVAPWDENTQRESSGLVIYTIYYADGTFAYRMHGIYNDSKEGFFACNINGNISGAVKDVPVTWNGAYDANAAGEYVFTAAVSGFRYEGENPVATITVKGSIAPESSGTENSEENDPEEDYGHDASNSQDAPVFVDDRICICPEGTVGHSDPACPYWVPLADCKCVIDSTSKPWQHKNDCYMFEKPSLENGACLCEDGHDTGNKDCLLWKPPLIIPMSLNGVGINDKDGNDLMLACASTSGNDPFNSIYTLDLNIPGQWVDYVNTIWMNKACNKFSWTPAADTDAHNNWAWGGSIATETTGSATTNPMSIPAASGGVWTVYSGEQLRYALTHFTSGQTIRLGANINLDGMNAAWTTRDTGGKNLIIDGKDAEGQKHAVCNMGVTVINGTVSLSEASFIRNYGNLTMRDIDFITAKVVANIMFDSPSGKKTPSGYFDGTGIVGEGNSTSAFTRQVINVTMEGCLIFGDTHTSYMNFDAGVCDNITTNVIAKGGYIYASDHLSGFVTSGGRKLTANYCASFDNLLCGIGGHSAGFNPCSTIEHDISNSFAANEMYGSRYVSGFIGSPGGKVSNCFATGKVEGYCGLGGFAWTSLKYGDKKIDNCYSTVLVGLRSQTAGITAANQMQGGFLSTYDDTFALEGDLTIEDSYAAGEVGNYDVLMSNPVSVGGFWSSSVPIPSRTKTFINCYYDKQTTAMREWTVGNSKSWAGITGCLTGNTVKAGTGLAGGTFGGGSDPGFKGFSDNSKWVYGSQDPRFAEHYPQLAVFVNAAAADWGTQARADEVKAWSLASTATVILDAWDEGYDWNSEGVRTLNEISYNRSLKSTGRAAHAGYVYTYDTVREIVSGFTATNSEANSTAWTIMIPGGASSGLGGGSAELPKDHVSIVNGKGSVGYPGLEWYLVSETYSGQTGKRPLRLISYMHVEAGEDKAILSGTSYDHRADVGLYMMDSITENLVAGPDDNKIWSRTHYQPYPNSRKYFEVETEPTNFPISEDAWLYTEIWRAKKDAKGVYALDSDGNLVPECSVKVSGPDAGQGLLADEQRWNGEMPHCPGVSVELKYIVTYYWMLNDGRYRTDTKVISFEPDKYDLKVNVYNIRDGSINNTALRPAASPYTGAVPGYTFGGAASSAQALGNSFATNMAAAWDKTDPYIKLKKIELITKDAAGRITGNKTITGKNLVEGAEIAIPIDYYYTTTDFDADAGYAREETKKTTVTIAYTVQKDTNGGYFLQFNKMANPPDHEAGTATLHKSETGISQTDAYVNDISRNIIVNLYVDETNDLKIEKNLSQAAGAEEKFVFQIDYRGNSVTAGSVERTMYAVITVPAGRSSGTAAFSYMPTGWYTVTELDSNWRYELLTDRLKSDHGAGSIIDAPGRNVTLWAEDNSAVYTYWNDRKDAPWVSGKAYVTNDIPAVNGYE